MRFFYFLLVCFSVLRGFSQKNSDIEKILNHPDLNSAIVGVSVKEVDSKKIIFEKNSHLQLVPASTFKLLTTLVALEKLGKDYRFKTEVYYSGSIKDSVLYGNLIVKGYGDPTIESRFFSASALQKIVKSIKSKNIRKIEGKLFILNNYFQPNWCGNWLYEDVNNYYAATPYPVNIYDNQFHLYLTTKEKGKYAAVVNIHPQYEFQPKIVVNDNEVVAKEGGDNAYIYGDPLGYEKRITGSIPPFQKEYSIEGVLPDPARMFADELMKRLNAENIIISANHYGILNEKESIDMTGATLLYTQYSPPLSEIIYLTNLHSINLFAESMMYALGNGNYESGKKEVADYLVKSGISSSEFNIDDACGLSRLNGISAHAMTELLIQGYQSMNKDIFLKSFPVAGVSGTMKSFTDSPPLKDKLRCKTGYFQRVRSFAGYMQTQSGKTIAICVLYNNFNVSPAQIKNITKNFFETLYQNL
ncbi:MAG: peptidase M15 [Bacteroidia bacterium]|nr:MAG: peptidase M15 [Bacteroidia bacterium]